MIINNEHNETLNNGAYVVCFQSKSKVNSLVIGCPSIQEDTCHFNVSEYFSSTEITLRMAKRSRTFKYPQPIRRRKSHVSVTLEAWLPIEISFIHRCKEFLGLLMQYGTSTISQIRDRPLK